MLNIVLYEPEMPMNTGNIGRSCVATNTRLHLIEPLGFKLNDKMVKRAGLDYWPHLDVTVYSDFKDFLEKNPGARPYMATTKTTQVYTDVHYDPDCYIMFGPESRGIPEELLIEDPERCVRIPMWGETRSLNLSNSVAIILYEALRHNGFCPTRASSTSQMKQELVAPSPTGTDISVAFGVGVSAIFIVVRQVDAAGWSVISAPVKVKHSV